MSMAFLHPSIHPSIHPSFTICLHFSPDSLKKYSAYLLMCILTCVCCLCSSGSEGRGGLSEVQGVSKGGHHRRAPRIIRQDDFIHVGGAKMGLVFHLTMECGDVNHVCYTAHPTARCYPELAHTNLTFATKRLHPTSMLGQCACIFTVKEGKLAKVVSG